jgi:foldase protein PrsA
VSKLSTRITALSAAALLCAGLSACGGIPSDAVVQVNGTPITKDTFNHWIAVAASSSSAAATTTTTGAKPVIPVPPNYTACIAHLQVTAPKPAKGQAKPTAAALKSQCETQYNQFKQQVLPYLISSEWVIGEAAERGVKVSDEEVKKEFNKIRSGSFPHEADFQKFLTRTGYTVSDLLLRVKLNLVAQKIEKKVSEKSKVTTAQAQAYYNKHQSNYGAPEKRDLLVVLTKTQAQAEKAKSEISSGKSFASVAKKSSIDPVSKATGGSLPGVVKGQEEKALDEAVFAAKVNVLGGPVKTPFGYYIFQVKKITPGTQQSFAQAQSQVKQQLASEEQQNSLSTFKKEFVKKWTARTECRAEYMVAECKGYKAPKSTSTAPPVTATAQGTTTTPATTSTPSTGAKKK